MNFYLILPVRDTMDGSLVPKPLMLRVKIGKKPLFRWDQIAMVPKSTRATSAFQAKKGNPRDDCGAKVLERTAVYELSLNSLQGAPIPEETLKDKLVLAVMLP